MAVGGIPVTVVASGGAPMTPVGLEASMVAVEGGGSVQDAVGTANEAWTEYTPTFAAGAGSLAGVASVSGRYSRVGRLVFFQAQAVVTDAGTATLYLTATLPVPPAASGYRMPALGKDFSTNFTLNVEIAPDAFGNDLARVYRFDGTFPTAAGQGIEIAGFYEAADA